MICVREMNVCGLCVCNECALWRNEGAALHRLQPKCTGGSERVKLKQEGVDARVLFLNPTALLRRLKRDVSYHLTPSLKHYP